jgi:hypothetical protein
VKLKAYLLIKNHLNININSWRICSIRCNWWVPGLSWRQGGGHMSGACLITLLVLFVDCCVVIRGLLLCLVVALLNVYLEDPD